MITKTLCIKNFKDSSPINNISGISDNGVIVHYTGQTNSNAYICKFNILLVQNIDDIGIYTNLTDDWKPLTDYSIGYTVIFDGESYKCNFTHTSDEYFSTLYWDKTPIDQESEYTVTITGESKIDLFRRFGKVDTDPDLYNPASNNDFNNIIIDSNGNYKQITGQRENPNGLDYQPLYDYKLTNKNGGILEYSDIGNGLSEISYKTSGLTNKNSIDAPSVKLDYLMGVVSEPKINIDVFINRGNNSSYEKHIRLSEVKSLDDLMKYGNGYYKIKED